MTKQIKFAIFVDCIVKLQFLYYCLSDPETGEIRYIGKTVNLGVRFSGHIRRKHELSHKSSWIKSILARNLKPVLEVLEEIKNSDGKDWQEAERFWISYFRFLGIRLTNLDSGGHGKTKHCAETIEKLRVSHRGKKMSPETLIKMSQAQKNVKRVIDPEKRLKLIHGLRTWKPSPEQAKVRRRILEKAWAANRGRKMSPESIENMRKAKKGTRPSEATLQAAKAALKTRIITPETREKIRRRLLGRKMPPRSPEFLAMLSRTHTGRVHSEEERKK